MLASYLRTLSKFKDYRGRACRTEFWIFMGFNFSVSVVLIGISIVLAMQDSDAAVNIVLLIIPFYLIMLPSEIALHVRRLHDLNQSGWLLIVLYLVPYAIMIVGCIAGNKGNNRFGPASKQS